MKKSMYFFIMAIGASSILNGIFSLFKGSEFSSYFFSIFVGSVLIVTNFYHQKRKK